MTNADRIRQMTDEELSRLISADWCEILKCFWTCDGNCEPAVLKWLRKEVVE